MVLHGATPCSRITLSMVWACTSVKAHIHPPYRTVVFHDTSVNEYFKVGSTIRTDRVIELDGETFPYVTIDVSSKSHPYYTGKQKTFASEGSAARFRQRFGGFIDAKRKA